MLVALNAVDPFTEDRGDHRAAIIAQTYAVLKSGEGQRLDEFMMDYMGERDRMKEKFEAMLADESCEGWGN